MIALSAGAGPSSQKTAVRRAEAQDIEDAILHGEGSLNAQLNRVHYLGQEGIVSADLSDLVRKAHDVQQIRNIATALADLAHPHGEAGLLLLAQSDDGATRMAAARGLGRLKSAVSMPKLLAMLTDKTLGVRREAARALGLLRNPKAGGPLMKAAQAEGEPEVREAMLVAVGLCGDKRQAAALERFLEDSSESARFAAAQGLCDLGAKSGFDFAKKRMASEDRYERMRGVMLFEGSQAKEVSSVLTPLLDDKDRSVAAATARILFQGGDAK
jgi:HEAT repeat protein